MDHKKPQNTIEPTTTRRSFARKAYMVPAVLAAIKASETVANAQAPDALPPAPISSS